LLFSVSSVERISDVADAIIRKMTGHRSEELERYKQLSPAFKQQTVELIAGQLSATCPRFCPRVLKTQKAAPKSDQMCLI